MKLPAILISLTALAVSAADFEMIRNGQPAAVLVASSDQAAADSLFFFNDAVQRCIGKKMPLVKTAAQNQNSIRIELVNRPVDSEDLYTITFPDAKTLLITGTKISVKAALSFILEEYFGCRFLFPVRKELPYGEEINHYPNRENVSVPVRTVRKTAAYNLKRHPNAYTEHWDWRWNTRKSLACSHLLTLDAFPAVKYAADQSWPKEMLPVLNGKKYLPAKMKPPFPRNQYLMTKRYCAHWNPCFSHPKSAEIAIANILERLANRPSIRELGVDMKDTVCLGINDNGGMCKCELCRKNIGKGMNQVGRENYSEIYWKWVNRIAEAVSKKFPDVYFTALAYREVIDPPSFKLHPKVVPTLCFELVAMDDPEVAAQRRTLLQGWKEKSVQIGFWDYVEGMNCYVLPRISFKSHSEKLEMIFRDYNTRALSMESYYVIPSEGPRMYLAHRKSYDLSLDPEKVVMDWISAAVGRDSAPYLRQYYQFWEDYWNSEAIKKTNWYQSRFRTYFTLNELTHTLALQKGDMKKLRALMETVIAKTRTPQQRKRAQVLMQCFELSECAVTAMFSELIRPDGKLADAADAAELLRQIPQAEQALEKLKRNPLVKFFRNSRKIRPAQLANISLVMPFIKDPMVKKEAEKLLVSQKVSTLTKSLLKIWLGANPKNLLSNGSFEKNSPLPSVLWNEGGAYRSAKMASDGFFSFRMPHFCSYMFQIPAQPGKTYMVLFDCFLKQPSIEGEMTYQVFPMCDTIRQDNAYYPANKLQSGKWTAFSAVSKVEAMPGKHRYFIRMWMWFRKFEENDEIYLDNVRFYCLDDLNP